MSVYLSTPNLCTGSCSTPRQGLPGDHQRSPRFHWSHSRTKYSSQEDKVPTRGACREGHLRHQAPARGARQEGPGKRSLPGWPPEAQSPRQEELAGGATQGDKAPARGACWEDRGKALAATSYYSAARAPAHPPTCRSGIIPGVRGERLCSQGHVVAKRR